MEDLAEELRHEYLTPEHAIKVLLPRQHFRAAFSEAGGNPHELETEIDAYLSSLERVPENVSFTLRYSSQFAQVLDAAFETVVCSSQTEIKMPHILKAILSLPDSTAAWLLKKGVSGDEGGFISAVVMHYSNDRKISEVIWDDLGEENDLPDNDGEQWKRLVTCLNDNLEGRNPLIGRDRELARTIQVLCRKDKNNPLHIGEPGVGKTALVYGLARMINEEKVPERLKGARIYGLDLGTLLAGTQFRGDFEKRLKLIMDGLNREGNVILYIDEIHSLVGAGATGESSMDASNFLKPYLESGTIRFIGSTTYDEYKRHFAKSKGLVRRFSHIDIPEPSQEETIDILNQLKGNYEKYHGVTYQPEAIEFAVKGSMRHISDRFLPDKAIDLIDEAGAFRQANPDPERGNTVDAALVADILAKICKVDALSVTEDTTSRLESLQERIHARIYGQDDAVKSVTEAVQLAKAGLTDDDKPLASLLFVGPTGVGKTEVAKVLADELGIGLIRFDMSEYTEKHTVAKLIGSPAGYVGYEDGGLLTDAIRKTPDCVLLLDEIEKAHPDIYNILLQVMDYARLTDNKGNKADFRNVVLIMTSNAGAQYASQANVGFASNVSAGAAMLSQVKKTFKPEFINRLSSIVVFNDMDRRMASLILDKKLRMLESRLKEKNVDLILSEEAREHLLSTGFSREYGAREIDRKINTSLKPILMREILFGTLKEGGTAKIALENGCLKVIKD
ncbi:MAG: AAA family ATPase [Muribaculaceae bacterium]|nr:AAA family ATPase [Muribaculaceae bacterium]